MDPEAALKIMKGHIQEAEGLLNSPHYSNFSQNQQAARFEIDDAFTAQRDIADWIDGGGFRPKQYEKWLTRLIAADKKWHAQFKRHTRGF